MTSAVTVALTELAARKVRKFLKQENLSLENPNATGGCACGTSFSAQVLRGCSGTRVPAARAPEARTAAGSIRGLAALPDDARLWIFGASRPLGEQDAALLISST
jgi:hypothetical protein